MFDELKKEIDTFIDVSINKKQGHRFGMKFDFSTVEEDQAFSSLDLFSETYQEIFIYLSTYFAYDAKPVLRVLDIIDLSLINYRRKFSRTDENINKMLLTLTVENVVLSDTVQAFKIQIESSCANVPDIIFQSMVETFLVKINEKEETL